MESAPAADRAIRASLRALSLVASGAPWARELASEAAAALRAAAPSADDPRDRAALEAVSAKLAQAAAPPAPTPPWLVGLLAGVLGGAVGAAGALLAHGCPPAPGRSMGQEGVASRTTALALGAMALFGVGLGAVGFFHRQEWWGAVALGAGSSVVGGAGVLLVNRLVPNSL